jgi:hypothetical protein
MKMLQPSKNLQSPTGTIPVKQDVPNYLLDKLIKVYARLRSFYIWRGVLSRQTC